MGKSTRRKFLGSMGSAVAALPQDSKGRTGNQKGIYK
jgi:hypothetical protein